MQFVEFQGERFHVKNATDERVRRLQEALNCIEKCTKKSAIEFRRLDPAVRKRALRIVRKNNSELHGNFFSLAYPKRERRKQNFALRIVQKNADGIHPSVKEKQAERGRALLEKSMSFQVGTQIARERVAMSR